MSLIFKRLIFFNKLYLFILDFFLKTPLYTNPELFIEAIKRGKFYFKVSRMKARLHGIFKDRRLGIFAQ